MTQSVDSTALHEALRQNFGYTEFRPLQLEIITTLLNGDDAFVLMPTGGGKSLCFQLPALVLPGLTVVVSPLIALMKDQVDGLKENGIAATFINSSLDPAEIARRRNQLVAGEIRLLYVAPERFSGEFWNFLGQLNLSLFAIDEAHCISEWGHDFRVDYRTLSRLRARFPHVPIVAMTATANARVQDDVVEQLRLREGTRRFVASFDRPNLFYEVRPKQRGASQIFDVLERHRGESGIIYCQSRARTEDLASLLSSSGYNALPYHAGLERDVRTANQERFVRDKVDIICATIAFGMGIDKPDVRFVIHYDLPKNLMSYYQETGRAGRDGLPSDCVLLYSPGDRVRIMKFFSEISSDEERAIAMAQLNEMTGYAESAQCRRSVLLRHFGEEYHSPTCEGCDNCTNPDAVETYDATRNAQMLMSCIVRVREGFGLGHVIDILRGSENARLLNLRHNLLPTYGIGTALSKEEWRMLGHALIREGYLRQDDASYGAIRLTPDGASLLRERRQLMLKRPRAIVGMGGNKRKAIDLPPQHLDLFERLRAVRMRIAERLDVPAFVVFDNRTLVQMAAAMPRNERELRTVQGVGEHKARTYGPDFLEAIADWERDHPDVRPVAAPITRTSAGARRNGAHRDADVSVTTGATLRLFERGLGIEEIARERGLSPNTVAGHLVELVSSGEIPQIDRLVDPNKIAAIESAFDTAGISAMRPVREQLGEEYTYHEIALVRAWVMAVREKE